MVDAVVYDDEFFKNVANKHPEYDRHLPRWQKNRIVCSGSDAVKNAGVEFLPKLEGQNTIDYNGYKLRANFFPAAKKTLGSITGMIHAKAPIVTFPKVSAEILDTIGMDDSSISEISMLINWEQAMQGRVGLLSDYEEGPNGVVNPYFAVYKTENIWNWKETKIQGKTRLSMVVLEEKVPTTQDLFNKEETTQLRVIFLGDDGFVRVAVLQQTDSKQVNASGQMDYKLTDEVKIPLVRGQKLTGIPFQIIGAQSISPRVEDSPIESIIDTNISQYITSADLEHGRHYTALPTYYVIADTQEDPQLTVGGPSFIHIKSPATESAVGILEYTGQGLGALEKGDEQKKQEMAVLGARMLQAEKKQAEAADTVRLRQASENSVIANIARTASRALTYALKNAANQLGLPSVVSFELTTDFLTISIDPQMVEALAGLVATNQMSIESFFYNLAQGGLYPDGHTFDKERDQIEADINRSPNIDSDKADMDLGDNPYDKVSSKDGDKSDDEKVTDPEEVEVVHV